jgi:ABC-type branched-subunit amino acid transport system ATPase component
MTSFLEVKDVRKSYGAIKAVDGVSFAVAPVWRWCRAWPPPAGRCWP